MASLTKLIYLLIVLSIAADFINLGGHWFNTHSNDGEVSVHSSSMFLSGANGLPIAPVIIGAAARVALKAAAKALSKSAIKAAKKKAKNQARVLGNARNKAKKSQGGAEHTKNARKSTRDKHQKGQARRNRDQQRSNKPTRAIG